MPEIKVDAEKSQSYPDCLNWTEKLKYSDAGRQLYNFEEKTERIWQWLYRVRNLKSNCPKMAHGVLSTKNFVSLDSES